MVQVTRDIKMDTATVKEILMILHAAAIICSIRGKLEETQAVVKEDSFQTRSVYSETSISHYE
jgi:threonine synthase